jgi:hypothetical protein
VWFQPPQNWLAQRLYNENSKETAKETNENRKWNWKRNRNKTESDPINKNEPWTDKLKMNWLTAQTNWIISKWASPKKVTAGWARRDVICRALCCLFLIFEQRSYCPASISRTSWPPTPAKTNSGTLTCYNVFRGKLASWNLEFCNSCVVLLRNVQVPRRNSDSHLVFRDPTQLRAKKRI